MRLVARCAGESRDRLGRSGLSEKGARLRRTRGRPVTEGEAVCYMISPESRQPYAVCSFCGDHAPRALRPECYAAEQWTGRYSTRRRFPMEWDRAWLTQTLVEERGSGEQAIAALLALQDRRAACRKLDVADQHAWYACPRNATDEIGRAAG